MASTRKARPPLAFESPSALVADPLNQRILAELQADPRISMSELGRRINASAPTATERVRRLEAAKVITGYRVDIDPGALGRPVAAFVRVRPGPGQLPKIKQLADELPEVVECHRITGEDCFLIKIHVAEIDDLDQTLDRFLLFGSTTTSIIQSTPVPPRPLPFPAAASPAARQRQA